MRARSPQPSLSLALAEEATAEAKPKPAAGFEIDPAQVQDLADRIADLQTAGAGYALRFRLAAVLDDDTPAEVRAAVDRLLDESLTDRPPDP